MLLADVKVGDRLVCIPSFGTRLFLVTVSMVTPKQIVVDGAHYSRDTGRKAGGERRVRLPEPGEVERLDAEEAQRAAKQTAWKAELDRRAADPAYQTASHILTMSEAELVAALGAERLAVVAGWLEEAKTKE